MPTLNCSRQRFHGSLISVPHYALARNEEGNTIVVSFPTKRAPRSARTCRRLERHFRRTRAPLDKQVYVQARSVARDLIKKSRADALTAKVNESAGDSKKTWNTTRKLLHSKPVTSMSNDECASMSSGAISDVTSDVTSMSDDECASMSSASSQFFSDKVAGIQHAIADFIKTISCCPVQMLRPFVGSPLLVITSASSADSRSSS